MIGARPLSFVPINTIGTIYSGIIFIILLFSMNSLGNDYDYRNEIGSVSNKC